MQSRSDLLGIPKKSFPTRTSVVFKTGNGYGSTNTSIRLFTTITVEKGGDSFDIRAVNDPVNGSYAVVQETGIYAISRTDGISAGGAVLGISVNAPGVLSSGITTFPVENILVYSNLVSSATGAVSATALLIAGDIIRAHDSGTLDTTTNCFMRITRVG